MIDYKLNVEIWKHMRSQKQKLRFLTHENKKLKFLTNENKKEGKQ
jgi:hypothetical protein